MHRPARQRLGQAARHRQLRLHPQPYLLYAYHVLIMDEMQQRGYRPDPAWRDKNHRGNTCPPYPDLAEEPVVSPIYAEHDDDYLAECLANLRSKGIEIQG